MYLFSYRSCFRGGILLFLINILIAPAGFAQSSVVSKHSRVFQGQYVVELNSASGDAIGTSHSISTLSSIGAQVVRSLGNGRSGQLKLIRSGSISSRLRGSLKSTETTVEYNKEDQFCIDLIKSGAAKHCSPDFEIRISDVTPNDPSFPSLWGLSAEKGIDAPSAWNRTTGSSEVVVAVIDTGIDYNHADLAANVWRNSGEIAGNGIDDDGNGYVDDIYGWNASAHNGDPFDDNGHGTHCAGTIGGVGNNGTGVSGINWNVKIMGLKFLSSSGAGSLSGAIEAINYMVAMKNRGVNIRVASNSWGGGGYADALYSAIEAAKNAGIVFVAAAGNEGNDNDANPSYPATYELSNVVSVAALDSSGNMASFSNYGAQNVDIAAPGVSILSTYTGNRYATLSGTSMATPHVSGALALLFANEPWLSVDQAIDRMYLTGKQLNTLTGLVRTGRFLNVGRMINNLTSPLPPAAPPAAPCAYSVAPIAFNPDRTVESAEVVIQADEYGFYSVSLPFSFQFFREQVSQIYVSPNGVVYTKAAPSGMDYQNSERAPLNSIAALHSDLTTQNDPYSVRVKIASNYVTVYWLAETYSRKGIGDSIQSWLTIYSDGTIDDSASFASAGLLSYMQGRTTVGVSGSSASDSAVYAYNNSNIQNNMAVRFTPQCTAGGGSGTATVSKIQLTKSTSGRKASNTIEPGKSLKIDLIGTGTGVVNLQASFNGKSCQSTVNVAFDNGRSLKGRMPKVPAEFSSLKLKSGSGKKTIAIRHSYSSRITPKRINAKKLQKYCESFFTSLTGN